MAREVGVCNDGKCAVHGGVKVRGNIFTGRVVSAKADKTAIVERTLTHYVHKYERYKNVRSRLVAHNPRCIGAKEQDVVRIGETRKLSKTKAFTILSVEGHAKAVSHEDVGKAFKEKKGPKGKAPVKEEGKE
ncbi:MAG TPA: 30S ribosomal protein S17 [Candidatus Diapherotrites archaeon]|uniref:30S ribosomal protein S17 n=1 Tax=Candidatus Iainarchaeum sp. TaxID=3101447 RepID=A0A7J4JFN9_9ARCH|nr:30S ribosomal protein S17 [Candidatus Diapherotrites archaeon]HIH16528.1 30S ribosomal protein S17 [Candidatus Diapherotrites archaeon]